MKQDQKNLLKGYNLLLYFAGSMIMYEPTEECVTDFWTNGTLKRLPVSSTNPKFIKAAALLRDSCKDKNIFKKMLQEDYLRLFAETGLILAPVHASDYHHDEIRRDKSYNEISEFYNSYGWNSNSRVKRTDDHLGIELLFLTRLIDRYLLLDDDPSCHEMGNEIHRFIDQHILSWIPEWNVHIQEHAQTLSYKGIGTLILACIEDLHTIFSYSDNPL
ncbi:MAG: molecular chaperone TorD family protein [Bacteroidales bacterium]|nr:molecular chaperone TorD family protein [Bacteroidales bacterium]